MYKRALWLTDIHIETVSEAQYEAFLVDIVARTPDTILLTGDIDESNLTETLRQMANRVRVPIYFVLGNHDYYRKTIANVRSSIEQISKQSRYLRWLPSMGIVELTPSIGLIGHDGWSDGRYGDFLTSSVILQDYLLIRDLMDSQGEALLKKLNRLGDYAARHIRRYLPQAMERYDQVVVLLHMPPFQEATWYMGNTPTDDDPYLPHFACKAVGDVLLEIVPQHPDTIVTVLCGHTHSSGEVQILDNLFVRTGQAEYGAPEIQHVFELE